jgi:hypothetical protein
MGTFNSPFPASGKTFGPVGGATGYVSFSPFAATATATVGNSVAETSLLGTGIGTKTIPANYLSIGTMIKIYITGTIGTDAVVPAITIKTYYGATALSTATATPAAQITAGTIFEYTATCIVTAIGASGSLTSGQVAWPRILTALLPGAAPAAVTVDTTVAGAIDAKITWGTANANNTISALTGYIEVIG